MRMLLRHPLGSHRILSEEAEEVQMNGYRESEKWSSSTSVVSGGVLIGRKLGAEVGLYHSRDVQ
jgi:hypothetical protein